MFGIDGSSEKERIDRKLENARMKQEIADIKQEIADMKLEKDDMRIEMNRLTFGLQHLLAVMMIFNSTLVFQITLPQLVSMNFVYLLPHS